MLPHDELYHYGVKGMKWGVRRELADTYGLSETTLKRRAKIKKQYAKKYPALSPIFNFGAATDTRKAAFHGKIADKLAAPIPKDAKHRKKYMSVYDRIVLGSAITATVLLVTV